MQKSQEYFQITRLMRYLVLVLMAILLFATIAIAAPGEKAPKRTATEGEGPHPEMILRGVNLINGEGAPVRGPVDIVVKKNV